MDWLEVLDSWLVDYSEWKHVLATKTLCKAEKGAFDLKYLTLRFAPGIKSTSKREIRYEIYSAKIFRFRKSLASEQTLLNLTLVLLN